MAKLKVGDRAPEFELPGTGGKTYRLSDYRGRKLILAFYPGDFTAVCTRQFCSYRDEGERLDGLGADVLGISSQSVDSHERFVKEKSLNVPLLADEDKEVARAYGVAMGPVVRRATFVVDEEGIVRHANVSLTSLGYDSVEDLEQALAAIARCRRRPGRVFWGPRLSSVTGSRRRAATSSTARGRWLGPAIASSPMTPEAMVHPIRRRRGMVMDTRN
jgi:peroxiredoxin Q/BCP